MDLQTWYVYEDDPTSHARIHVGDCSRCNHGKGIRETRLPNNRWSKAFTTLDAAIEHALSTRAKDVAGCRVCQPLVGTLR
jgi:hypothetical protein